MEGLFVTYKIAAMAKAHGFNEECFAKFYQKKREFRMNTLGSPNNYNDGSYGVGLISAPMYVQIIKWFSKEHKLQIGELPIRLGNSEKWYINDMSVDDGTFKGGYVGIEGAVEKAFELIKSKNNSNL